MKVSKGRIIFQCINYTILFLLMAAALYPVLYVLAASFSSFEFLAQGKVGIIPMGFTIDAYKRILSYPMIGRAYINTIFYFCILNIEEGERNVQKSIYRTGTKANQRSPFRHNAPMH